MTPYRKGTVFTNGLVCVQDEGAPQEDGRHLKVSDGTNVLWLGPGKVERLKVEAYPTALGYVPGGTLYWHLADGKW